MPKKSTCPQSLHSVAPTGNRTRDLLIANPTPNLPNSFCVFRQRATRIMHRSMNTRQHAMPMLFNGVEIPQNCPLPWGMRTPPPSNTWLLGPPHPHAEQHLDRTSRLFTAHATLSLYFTMGRPLSHPKICLLYTSDAADE